MNRIYDLILNYSSLENFWEFYEWMEGDSLITIEKIPAFKVNHFQMVEIATHRIRIDNSILESIENETVTEKGSLPYAMLVCDFEKVLALKFNSHGELIEMSSLLLDEEEAVLEEANLWEMECLSYEVLEEISREGFLTRQEKKIQVYLLNELDSLQEKKEYDEIHYLYSEIFSKKRTSQKEYECLRDTILHHFTEKLIDLYDIIQLTKA